MLLKKFRVALSFTIVQYAAVTRVRNFPIHHFLYDIVNNCTIITNASPYASVTIVHNFSHRHIIEFTKNVAFFMTYSSFSGFLHLGHNFSPDFSQKNIFFPDPPSLYSISFSLNRVEFAAFFQTTKRS